MVAQFLRLKLRLLGNIFRRSPWQVVGIVLGLVYGLGLAALLFMTLVGLRFVDDVELIRYVFIVAGSATIIGFVVVPLLFGVDDTMDPRRFALFGVSPDRTLPHSAWRVAAMIGVPALALGIILLGTVVTWSRGPGETFLAHPRPRRSRSRRACCSPASPPGSPRVLLATRRAREVSSVLGVLLIVHAVARSSSCSSRSTGRTPDSRVLETLAGVLGWTPLGAAFAVPGRRRSRRLGRRRS